MARKESAEAIRKRRQNEKLAKNKHAEEQHSNAEVEEDSGEGSSLGQVNTLKYTILNLYIKVKRSRRQSGEPAWELDELFPPLPKQAANQ